MPLTSVYFGVTVRTPVVYMCLHMGLGFMFLPHCFYGSSSLFIAFNNGTLPLNYYHMTLRSLKI